MGEKQTSNRQQIILLYNFDNEMWLNIRLSFIKMHLIMRV